VIDHDDRHGHAPPNPGSCWASRDLVGVTPAVAATAAAPFVQNPGDLLSLLPGRSVTVTITGGWAPRR